MNSAAAVTDEKQPPVRMAPVRRTPLRLLPEQEDDLTRGRLELQAAIGGETDNSTLLQDFFSDEWPKWIERKNAEAKQGDR